MDNKNLNTQSYEEKFSNLYAQLCRISNAMDKRINMSFEMKQKLDKSPTLKDIDDNIKNEVWWELAIRLQLEKHILIDNSFSVISDALNKYDLNGKIYPCSFCGGNKKITCNVCQGSGVSNPQTRETCNACKGQGNFVCKMCGGSGKAVDHELSLRYKAIVMTRNSAQDVCGTLYQVNGVAPPNSPSSSSQAQDMLIGLYQGIYDGIHNGDMERDEALEALKQSITQAGKLQGASEKDIDDFFQGYFEYEKARRDAEAGGKGVGDSNVKGEPVVESDKAGSDANRK